MSDTDIVFQRRVRQEVVGILNNRWMTFLEILKRSLNCDPGVLLNEIRDLQSIGVVCGREGADEVRYGLRAKRKYEKKNEEEKESKEWRLKGREFVELEERIESIYESLPEASPVYSQWWYCSSVYERLMRLLLSIEIKDSRIAFIGCGTLGAVVSNYNKGRVDIFDIDEVLLNAIRSHCAKGTQFIRYDVTGRLERDRETRFPVVVVDPPWSRSLLKSFLVRTANFVCGGGTLIISFPQILTRPTAEVERKSLVELAERLGLVLQRTLVGFSEYGVPEFEKKAYESYGLKLDRAWRKGDLFIFRKEKKVSSNSEKLVKSMPKWEQFSQGRRRIFLKRDGHFENGKTKIQPVGGLESLVYQSTSSRKEAWKGASLVSTRNCVARAYGRRKLSMILKEMLIEKGSHRKRCGKLGVLPMETIRRRILDMLEV